MKTAQEAYTSARNIYSKIATSFAGVLDKMPEDVRAMLKPVHDELNTALSKLQPLEQIEQAQQANYALENLGYVCTRLQDAWTGLMDKLNSIQVTFGQKVAALNGEITAAVEKAVTDGVHVTKEAHEAALLALGQKHERRDARRAELAVFGAPAPSDLALLDAEDAAWKAFVATTKERKTKLDAAGIQLEGNKAVVAIYGSADVFDLALNQKPAKRANPAGGGGGDTRPYTGAV